MCIRDSESIETELDGRIAHFKSIGKELEAHRIEQKTRYDLEMLREIGHCQSIENYSLHFDGRERGQRPYVYWISFQLAQSSFMAILKNSWS